MSNIMRYNGYCGSVEHSLEDMVLHGKILFINDLVTYEADTLPELEQAFHEEVDDYIAFCEKIGKEPEKPFKGTFNVRIDPDLHKRAAIQAEAAGITLNQLVSDAIQHELTPKPDKPSDYEKELATISDSIQTMNNNLIAATTAAVWGCTILTRRQDENG